MKKETPITEEYLLKKGFINDLDEKYNPNDKYASSFTYWLSSPISYRNYICNPFLGWIIKIEQSTIEVSTVEDFEELFCSLEKHTNK